VYGEKAGIYGKAWAKGMVKVKGVEWRHVLVVKEPERHGMATLVRCVHCAKEFQGNAMRIRAHLLGNKRSAGVSGCPSCPEEAREELRLIDIAKSQVKRKRQDRTPRQPRATSSSDHSLDSAQQQMDLMAALQKGEKSAVEQAFRSMVFQAGGLPVNYVNFSPVKSAVCIKSFFIPLLFSIFFKYKFCELGNGSRKPPCLGSLVAFRFLFWTTSSR
jgi:hypothetical protein